MPGCRRLTYLALAAALAAMTAGCNNSADGSKLTLQTLAEPNSNEYKLLEAVLAEFGKHHPEVQVRLVGGRLKLDYLMRSIIARQAADVLEVRAGEVEFLTDRGALRPLTADCMSLRPECDARAWKWGTVGNELYAVPWAAQPKLLLYDKVAFREAGLPDNVPPRTWEELLFAAGRLTRDTDGDGKPDVYGFALAARRSVDLGRHFGTFLFQLGVPLLSLKDERWVFGLDSREGRRAMRFLLELQKHAPPECVVTDNEGAVEQFRSGKAAMVISGPAGLTCDPDAAKAVEAGVADMPAPAEGVTQCDVKFRYLCVPAFVRGERAAAAARLAKFIAGADAQEIVARGVGRYRPVIPIRRHLLEDGAHEHYPELRAFADARRRAAPVFPSLIWEGKCLKDWLGGIHSLLIGDPRGVDEVISMAQKKGDQALSCLYTDIGRPTLTMQLGMFVMGALIFIIVAYGVSRH